MKEQISSSYIEEQKALHSRKPVLPIRNVALFGARDGNIGGTIAEGLKADGAWCNKFDIESGSDLTNQRTIKSIFNRDTKGWRPYDTLIVCQGYTSLNWIEHQDPKEIQKMIDVNLTSPITCISEFVASSIDLDRRKYIVIIGSMGGKAILNGSSPYCAAKAGINHFAKCISWELAPKGFDVFCVNPSNVEGTPMAEKTISELERYRGLSHDEAVDYWSASLPRADWLQASDIFECIKFLVSGKAGYLSGCSIDLAGGQR